jgi:hypothetical protein
MIARYAFLLAVLALVAAAPVRSELICLPHHSDDLAEG